MEGPLARIAEEARQVAEAISAAFGIDAEVVDRRLMVVAGTGIYTARVGQFEEGGVGGGLYGRVLATGVAEAALDTSDPSYDPIIAEGGHMPEKVDLAAPIMHRGRAEGLVGLAVFTEEQAKLIRERSDAVLDFCQHLANLLGGRLAYLDQVDQLAQAHAQLQLIQDHIDEGIALVGQEGRLLLLSGPAFDLVGPVADGASWQTVFPGAALPPGSGRVRLQSAQGRSIVGDVRALPQGGPTLVIMRSQEAMQQLAYELTTVHKPVGVSELVGRSQPAQLLRREVQRLAARDECVLIWAESGSGASTVAAALHDNGPRQGLPFVVVHIAATAESALQAALFGREELAGNEGAFALAQGGSLLLDGVDRLPLRLQERLLTWLRERLQVSDTYPRLITTTSHRLADAVRRGEFLGDLYGHLGRSTLRLLPLRQRKADLPDIAQAFLDRLDRHQASVIDPSALRLLLQYPWPGNLREMGAVIEVAARRAAGPIMPEHLPERMQVAAQTPGRPLDEMVTSFETSVIEPLLRAYGADTAGKRKVAERLGISLATLYRKLRNS